MADGGLPLTWLFTSLPTANACLRAPWNSGSLAAFWTIGRTVSRSAATPASDLELSFDI